MIDMGESDARRAVPQSEDQQEGVFRRFRDRLKGLTKTQFGSTIETVVNNKERQCDTMKNWLYTSVKALKSS